MNSASSGADRQRAIQDDIDRHEDELGHAADPHAAQTDVRRHPENPLPRQHQHKPGSEADLKPRPQYKAPDYIGSDKLKGMIALITGGDSGIGRAVAVLYAREGADVAIVHLPEEAEDAAETCHQIKREGRQALSIAGDVKSPDFCRQAVEKTVQAFSRLDILVNNAAFQEHARDIAEISDEHFDETIRTNVYGYFHMARAALEHIGRGGSIINTGSETGLGGSGGLLDYSMTKGAIHAFTKALASNVADRGIRVNAVAPGPVWTPLNPADRPEQEIESFGSKTDIGRPAQPEEISPAYVFLAAPSCASYITGIVLPVMGAPM
ncbi:SDR family oxidoreductase [Oleiagrimonas sp. C23AA]|uniref:SDR family oxidoreductase n=1 Tax=Oleiagrimonas sp. C23AA TaxID=2719047 RepID=UPI00141F8F0D|nr:SDR family oxidoreductase [Oleiagrimonas sp. C23AA]NII10961.1 SDR family oxidoreductase [Oleiagrimonas sp. C23AA]